MTRARYRLALAVVTSSALTVRLVWVRMANHRPEGLVDPARYLGYAEAIASGRGMIDLTGNPTAYYPPGFPIFAGVITWLGKPLPLQSWTLLLLVQALIGAATCLLGASVAHRLAGRRAGVAAAVVLAIYPNLVFHTGAILGETLFNALFLGFLAVIFRWIDDDTRPAPLLFASAVLLGMAVLVRPISLAVLPIVLLALWWRDRGEIAALRTTATLGLVVLLCIAPWTVRNALRMGRFVPLSTNTGENLCIGNSPDADGAFTLSDHCYFGDVLESSAVEVEIDQKKTRYALERIVAEPGRQPWLVWRRFWFTWIRDGDHDGILASQSYNLNRWLDPSTERALIRAADIAYVAVVITSLGGLVVLLRRRRTIDLVLVGSTVAIAAVPLAFFGDARFKVPAISLLILIAVGGLSSSRPEPEGRFDPNGPGEGSPSPSGGAAPHLERDPGAAEGDRHPTRTV